MSDQIDRDLIVRINAGIGKLDGLNALETQGGKVAQSVEDKITRALTNPVQKLEDKLQGIYQRIRQIELPTKIDEASAKLDALLNPKTNTLESQLRSVQDRIQQIEMPGKLQEAQNRLDELLNPKQTQPKVTEHLKELGAGFFSLAKGVGVLIGAQSGLEQMLMTFMKFQAAGDIVKGMVGSVGAMRSGLAGVSSWVSGGGLSAVGSKLGAVAGGAAGTAGFAATSLLLAGGAMHMGAHPDQWVDMTTDNWLGADWALRTRGVGEGRRRLESQRQRLAEIRGIDSNLLMEEMAPDVVRMARMRIATEEPFREEQRSLRMRLDEVNRGARMAPFEAESRIQDRRLGLQDTALRGAIGNLFRRDQYSDEAFAARRRVDADLGEAFGATGADVATRNRLAAEAAASQVGTSQPAGGTMTLAERLRDNTSPFLRTLLLQQYSGVNQDAPQNAPAGGGSAMDADAAFRAQNQRVVMGYIGQAFAATVDPAAQQQLVGAQSAVAARRAERTAVETEYGQVSERLRLSENLQRLQRERDELADAGIATASRNAMAPLRRMGVNTADTQIAINGLFGRAQTLTIPGLETTYTRQLQAMSPTERLANMGGTGLVDRGRLREINAAMASDQARLTQLGGVQPGDRANEEALARRLREAREAELAAVREMQGALQRVSQADEKRLERQREILRTVREASQAQADSLRSEIAGGSQQLGLMTEQGRERALNIMRRARSGGQMSQEDIGELRGLPFAQDLLRGIAERNLSRSSSGQAIISEFAPTNQLRQAEQLNEYARNKESFLQSTIEERMRSSAAAFAANSEKMAKTMEEALADSGRRMAQAVTYATAALFREFQNEIKAWITQIKMNQQAAGPT